FCSASGSKKTVGRGRPPPLREAALAKLWGGGEQAGGQRRRRAGRGRRVRWPRSSRGCRGRGLQAPGPSTPRLLGGRSPRPREKGISEYFRVCSAAGTAPTPARVSSVTTRPRKAPTDLLPSAPSGGGPPRARRAPRAPSER
ncbi:unnamed protein product, partial [Prorocentrum cordatum]